MIQHGNRKGFQPAEVILAVRLLIEKSIEWGLALVLLKIDVLKAHDMIDLNAFKELLQARKVPLKIMMALLRELGEMRIFLPKLYGMYGHGVWMLCGLRQGSPEAGILFAAWIGWKLETLCKSWKERGLGFMLGKVNGHFEPFWTWKLKYLEHVASVDVDDIHVAALGFADDILICASGTHDSAIMLKELCWELSLANLEVQPNKLQWLGNKYIPANACIPFGHGFVKRVDCMEILGSVITANANEEATMMHRAAQSQKVFYKWQKVLMCRGTAIEKRLAFWNKTVGASMTWALETTRSHVVTHKILTHAQRLQVVRMMGIKRRHFGHDIMENWIDWHIRRFREAKHLIARCGIDIVQNLKNKRTSFAGHVARFELDCKEPHVVKHILLWRQLNWWKLQQKYNRHICDHERFLHPISFGQPRRWEQQFPIDYLNKFKNS